MNEHLLARMHELRDLAGVVGLASWDQETYLPKKAEGGRGAQLATLQALMHERLVDPEVAEWLAAADAKTPDEVRLVQLFTRERERAVKLPAPLVKAFAEAQSRALSAWHEARAEKDFEVFQPHVQRLIELRREMADAWGHDGERYDALLESYEPGMRVKRLSPVLAGLRSKLVPLVQAIDSKPPPRRLFDGKTFDTEAQWKFTMHLLEQMGFDLEAGRQDRSTHPFTGGTGLFDVRLTTRLFPHLPLSSVFSTIHEGGHGLYEQGFDPAHERTLFAQAPSMGLHESQSRLWENVVGRSEAFWSHFFPRYQALFATQLAGVTLPEFLREVNRVERSFIRVEADEVTYNLHIVLRYELELELIRGGFQAKDLEAAWNEKTRQLLGLEVTKVTEGVLQDIHWAFGDFGYFPTYTLGNLYAASLWKAMNRDIHGLEESVRTGSLSPIRNWLREKVHREGFRHDAEALVTRVTGSGLTDADFVAYLQVKYGALYGM
jgi:carboxypeptidase Taq